MSGNQWKIDGIWKMIHWIWINISRGIPMTQWFPVTRRTVDLWKMIALQQEFIQRIPETQPWDHGTTWENMRKNELLSGFIKHGRLENGPFINDVPIKTSIHRGFSIAMFDYQQVTRWYLGVFLLLCDSYFFAAGKWRPQPRDKKCRTQLRWYWRLCRHEHIRFSIVDDSFWRHWRRLYELPSGNVLRLYGKSPLFIGMSTN